MQSMLRVYGYTAMFSKGDNFSDLQFAALDDQALPKWCTLLKNEFAPMGANCFF